jgi:hypothetical protein
MNISGPRSYSTGGEIYFSQKSSLTIVVWLVFRDFSTKVISVTEFAFEVAAFTARQVMTTEWIFTTIFVFMGSVVS